MAEAATAEAGIDFVLDGESTRAAPGETVWQVALRMGTEIPHLCLSTAPDFLPDGNCRLCMVEVAGRPQLEASCILLPEPGMEVNTGSLRAEAARRGVLELLMAEARLEPDSEAGRWPDAVGLDATRYPASDPVAPDDSHPGIAVDLAACIRCLRCLQVCRDIEIHRVIGMADRAAGAVIVFDLADPLGASRCVSCGSCAQACPTDALSLRDPLDAIDAD